VDFDPYTTAHVVTQLQLLILSALAFTVLKRTGIYPPELRSVSLDFDWTYRRAIPAAVVAIVGIGTRVWSLLGTQVGRTLRLFYLGIYRVHGPEGVFGRTWTTGTIAFWAVVGLGGYLLFYFWLR
jgi:multicomponent Na+:H+ antiporter subunit D